MTKAGILALLMLALFLATSFRKGWTRDETDFPNYYTAAVLVNHGTPLRDYYDWAWFQRQMNYAGIEHQLGTYVPQTPLTMLPMVPFAGFPVRTAKQIWLVLNLIFLAATLWMLSRATGIRIEYIAILMFLGYGSLQSNFRLGQYYVFLLFLLTLAFYCLDQGKSTASGFLCGVAFGLKLYGGPFLLYFAWKRNWKAVAGMLAATAIAVATAIALFGWADVHFYASQILPRSLEGEVIDPYSSRIGTLTTFLRHSLVMEADLNPQPLWNAPVAFFFLRPFTAVLILAFTLFGLASEGKEFQRRGFAWFTIAIVLLSSNAASYTYILLLLPVVLLLEHATPKEKIFLIVSYIALNFFVLPEWQRFFPKLWILAALFFVEGREFWRSFSPKLVAAALAAAILIAALDARRHMAVYVLEPGRNHQRIDLDRGTYLSTYPAVSSAGLFYQAMVRKGYVLRWLHDGQIEELTFPGQVFHPVAPSFDGPIYLELVKNGSSTSMIFDPATRSVVPTTLMPTVPAEGSVLSPDGKWMAVESTDAGPRQIWLRDLVSGKLQLVAGGNCNNSSPAWEEDSHTLIFASDCGRGIGMPVLYRANLPPQIHIDSGLAVFAAAKSSVITVAAQTQH
ncbi:MAG TPA: glycosyltransferase 87 family protein [Candidatus Acidoferrum sp.]|nr:glycosyltransferase 87 family protein [Candidatus Acidoferrum sp.]